MRVPEPEPTPEPPQAEAARAEPPGLPIGRILAGLLIIAAGVLWLLEATGAADVPWQTLLPSALIAIGVTLVLGWRSGAHTGLVVTGVILTVVLAAISTLGVPLAGGIGERLERPAAGADVRDEYRLAMGQLTVDLSGVELSSGARVRASVGLGELIVRVPEDTAVRIESRVSAGEVVVFGERRSSGVGVRDDYQEPGYDAAERRLILELRAGAGQIRVTRGGS